MPVKTTNIIRTQHWQEFIAENTTYFSVASATAAITRKLSLIFEVWLYDRQNEIGFQVIIYHRRLRETNEVASGIELCRWKNLQCLLRDHIIVEHEILLPSADSKETSVIADSETLL